MREEGLLEGIVLSSHGAEVKTLGIDGLHVVLQQLMKGHRIHWRES